jgi:phosphoribosylanthranilate isomerase
MVRIKICGITTLKDARSAVQHGADMLGFHFSRHSPYAVNRDDATAICDALRDEFGRSCPVLVGVFVDELVSNVSAISLKVGLDAAQLSGHESTDMLRELRGMGFKRIDPVDEAMAVDDVRYYRPYFPPSDYLPALMLDVFSDRFEDGPDARVELAQAINAEVPRLMLTGGFTPNNMVDWLQAVQPWAVDVNEAVDKGGRPGAKDPSRIKAMIDAVQSI